MQRCQRARRLPQGSIRSPLVFGDGCSTASWWQCTHGGCCFCPKPNGQPFADIFIEGQHHAKVGIDAPNRLTRSTFSRLASTARLSPASAGWINHEDCLLRTSDIGIFLSGFMISNQVVVANCNFEFNRVGVAINGGNKVDQRLHHRRTHRPGDCRERVWALTIADCYTEANNLNRPAYNIEGRLMTVFADVILTATGAEPWSQPYTFSAPAKPFSCTDAKIEQGLCAPPVLTGNRSAGFRCEGVNIRGNSFAHGKSQPFYSAVVVAGARGVALSGNYANYVAVPSIRGQSASLALTPPVSRSSHVDAWVADEVQWSGNLVLACAATTVVSAEQYACQRHPNGGC